MANSACRVLGQGATTCHAAIISNRNQELSKRALASKANNDKLTNEWSPVLNLTIDEVGMLACNIFFAVAFCATLGRMAAYNLDLQLYTTELFGNIPSVYLAGDFMQLPPVNANSLIHWHKPKAPYKVSLEVDKAWEIYKSIPDVVIEKPRGQRRHLDKSQLPSNAKNKLQLCSRVDPCQGWI